MSLFSGTITALENGLDYASQKQKVISNNIANSDTPKFKAKDVSFKKMLDQELLSSFSTYKTDNRHFELDIKADASSGVYVRQNQSYNNSGNSVDIDKEMSDLATNQIYYNALTDRISGKFQSLKNVIKGGN